MNSASSYMLGYFAGSAGSGGHGGPWTTADTWICVGLGVVLVAFLIVVWLWATRRI